MQQVGIESLSNLSSALAPKTTCTHAQMKVDAEMQEVSCKEERPGRVERQLKSCKEKT